MVLPRSALMASREMGAHPSERSLTGAPTAYAGDERGSPTSSASPVQIMPPLVERHRGRPRAGLRPEGFCARIGERLN
jgi:hypothetical protein